MIIPTPYKLAIYGGSIYLISYIYSRFKVSNLNLTKSFKHIKVVDEGDSIGKIYDDQFETKGNLNTYMNPNEHITSKNGLGDSLRSRNKKYRLKMDRYNLYLINEETKQKNILYTKETADAMILNFSGSKNLIRVLVREGYNDRRIGKWKTAKVFAENINLLKLTDQGDLIGYMNDVETWRNGVVVEDRTLHCEDSDDDDDGSGNRNPPPFRFPDINVPILDDLTRPIGNTFEELTDKLDLDFGELDFDDVARNPVEPVISLPSPPRIPSPPRPRNPFRF